MNWATKKREMAYEVVVWSKSDQRVTDNITVYSLTEGQQLAERIKLEDSDLNAWVKSHYRKSEEKAA